MDIYVPPNVAAESALLEDYLRRKLKGNHRNFTDFRVDRRSIDARKTPVRMRLRIELFYNQKAPRETIQRTYLQVNNAPEVAIIGMGPAGLYTALSLLELGIRPVLFERGKTVRDRRRDLVRITRNEGVNPDSNYCFGEGGAGTYSDGKLYTRSKKRGDIQYAMETLVYHGADPDILVDAHPHIGTNKLPGIIENMRNTIVQYGGEVNFNARVTDLIVENGQLKGIKLGGEVRSFERVVLATGHSARDIFEMLHAGNVSLEFKPFALGVRIEHDQRVVDRVQYHCEVRDEFLPPASYKLVHQTHDRGVYSFCMCPGGVIAPCATADGEVVTNGWSPSKRNNPFANSGIVTEIRWEDIPEFHHHGPLAGIAFQSAVEQACCEIAGGTQFAPAQRVLDFVEGKDSPSLPECSYRPGIKPARLDQVLPLFVVKALQQGLRDFGGKMNGFLSNNALVVAPESRTSCPVRIPRDPESLQHPEVAGLFPCGEGAGYAGGIISAAMDGEKIARKCHEQMRATGLV